MLKKSKVTDAFILSIEDGADAGGAGGPATDQPEPNTQADKPAGWKAPESQEDLDRIINKAVGRAHAKYADYDDLKAKAQRMEELELELSTATDRAVHAARQEERSKATTEFAPRLVTAEFRAAAKGVLTSDQLTSLIEDMDLSRYLTDKGDVDVDRIAKKVAAFAPKEDPTPPQVRVADLGQGRRSTTPEKGVDAGRSRYVATHKK